MKKAAHNIGSLKIENNPSSLWNGGSSSPNSVTRSTQSNTFPRRPNAQRQPETKFSVTQTLAPPFPSTHRLFLPEQAFHRLPRAGASPCTPPNINHCQHPPPSAYQQNLEYRPKKPAGLIMVGSKQYGLKLLPSVPSPAGGGRLGWGGRWIKQPSP